MTQNTGQPAKAVTDDAAHILVVDDDQRIRDLLGRFLRENGYRITTAEDAAVESAGEQPDPEIQ